MPISLHPSARYVTQSSIYDCPKLGRLTNRAIEKYKKLGYYSNGFIDKEERKERRAQGQGTLPKRASAALRAKKFMQALLE